MRFSPQDRLFVLTGAGISAESGLATFRGSGGLWNGHRVEEVATPEAWDADPALVWRFYSQRRRDALAAQPNAAHKALAQIEQRLAKTNPENFYLCTQNVDDLHERAGSRAVHHMHGELLRSRCESCDRPAFEDERRQLEELPRCGRCGGRLRPHVVWFGGATWLYKVQHISPMTQLIPSRLVSGGAVIGLVALLIFGVAISLPNLGLFLFRHVFRLQSFRRPRGASRAGHTLRL